MTTTLNLTKETKMLDLTKVAPSMKRARGVLDWNVHPIHKASLQDGFDLDIFVIATKNGKVVGVPDDVAFFNNKTIHNGGVFIPRDNRTGEGQDDEEALFELDKIKPDYDSLELFVFLFEAQKRQQNFSMIQGGSFTLYDADTKQEIQKYSLQQFANGNALHIGSFKRNNGGWGFQPVGDSADADANQVLSAFL